ncbi:MAG: hypothetical protein JW991_00385 [Candidatus Pacebacteria bacterium]|nr:hypothetical protein [Candidatus Paceibacterota bacterium]
MSEPVEVVEVPGDLPKESTFSFHLDAQSVIAARRYDTLGFDVTRPLSLRELEAGGVVFINVLGDAERTIIQQIGGQDFSQKLFLTDQDLKAARADSLPEGLAEKQLPEVGRDMALFVCQCQEAAGLRSLLYPEERQVGIADFRQLIRAVNSKLDRERRKGPFGQLKKPPKPLGLEREERLINETLASLRRQYPSIEAVRGIPVGNISYRTEGAGRLLGARCPVLECGHHFSEPMGVRVLDQDGSLTGQPGTILRFNEAVTHLAGHGICNTGTPEDPSQHYASLAEYQPIFAQRAAASKERIDVHQVRLEVGLTIARRGAEEIGFWPEDEDLKELVSEHYWPTFTRQKK